MKFLGKFSIAAVTVLSSLILAVILSLHSPLTASKALASDNTIVGSWYVNAVGAPFQPHVMAFHSDNTLLIDNPEAGDPHTSDSVGVGPWKYDQNNNNIIKGKFVEVNADRTTNQFVNNLVVTFTVTLNGDSFTGPAEANYYDANWNHTDGPFPATLNGTKIKFNSLP